jgi:hypothetical protein
MGNRWTFRDDHKSLPSQGGDMPSQWPVVPCCAGTRDLTLEAGLHEAADGMLTVGDEDAVVRLELNAAGVEFLVDQLPADDMFTAYVAFAREVAKRRVEAAAWDEAVSRG